MVVVHYHSIENTVYGIMTLTVIPNVNSPCPAKGSLPPQWLCLASSAVCLPAWPCAQSALETMHVWGD
jgi:hypothetical protein